MATMTAKAHGACSVCGKRFSQGALIDLTDGVIRHEACLPFTAPPESWWISCEYENGGAPYVLHEVIEEYAPNEPSTYVVVLHAEQREDGEAGTVYSACVRAATERECAPIIAAKQREAAREEVRTGLRRIIDLVRKTGTLAHRESPPPIGERLFDTLDGYDGGYIVAVNAQSVWYLERHMMATDDQIATDMAGEYQAWFLADAALVAEVRSLAALRAANKEPPRQYPNFPRKETS